MQPRAQRTLARRERTVEGGGADGEGVGAGLGERPNARGLVDAAGDDQLARERDPRRAHQIEGLGLGRAVGEQIDARAAQRLEAAAIGGDLVRSAAEPRRVPLGPAGKGIIGDAAAAEQGEGRLDLDELRAAIRPGETVLVSVMGANNETGVLFPIEQVAAIAHEAGSLLHVDGVQLIGKVDADWTRWPVDLWSLSAHKFHGPKGVGLLTAPRRVKLHPMVVGGGQERGLRSGTENPAGIVGMARALELALDGSAEAVPRMRQLRDGLATGLEASIEGLRISGGAAARNANTLHVTIAGIEAEPLLVQLDREGIAVSAGSACSSGALAASHVLRAMGVGKDRIHGVLRISLGRETTVAEVDRVLELLPPMVEHFRALG